MTITINGANDAAVISGDSTGTVTEAGGVNNGTPARHRHRRSQRHRRRQSRPTPGRRWRPAPQHQWLRHLRADAAGVWTYTLDNSNPAVQALNVGDTLTDSFTVDHVDGTAQLVTITINGANDAAVITGDTSGARDRSRRRRQRHAGHPDRDRQSELRPTSTTRQTTGRRSARRREHQRLRHLHADSGRVWTYTLDNSNAAVQALNVGGTLTDTFTVTTVDGTSQLVTITINGANDAAVITGDVTGTVTEAGGVANGTPGTPTATGDLNATDVDNPADAWTAVPAGDRQHQWLRHLRADAAGVWTYTLDNSNAAVQALNVGDTLTDSSRSTTVDGTAQLVTITINGANDAAVITGDTSGARDRGRRRRLNGTPGTPIATGDLNATDVDNPPDAGPRSARRRRAPAATAPTR